MQKTVTTDAGSFTAEVAGPPDGPMGLLLHGFPQFRHSCRHQVPTLAAAGSRAVAPGQRGYSLGARPNPATDLAAYGIDRLVGDDGGGQPRRARKRRRLTMNYDAALEVFFKPSPAGTPVPAPVANSRPPRRLRDASEPLAMHGVWSRTVNEHLAELGLNFLTGYVWGRAAALGEPPATLVASTFAVFEPGLIGGLYEEGRGRCSRADVLRVREEATIESLRGVLGNADVRSVVSALRRGVEAADGTGRPLFSGLRSLGWPADPHGQLWRACELLREHRGDSHIAACIGHGLGPVAMNILTELWVGMPLGSYTATRGWSPEVIDATVGRLRADGLVADGALTDTGQRLRDEIEARTDAMEQPIVEAIGDELDGVLARLDAWSAACVEASAFPPDIYKRAAG